MAHGKQNRLPIAHKGKSRGPMYPAKQRYQPSLPAQSPFGRNITDNCHLHTKGHECAAYVKRTITIRDAQGNVKKAKEVQFFGSCRSLGNLHIDEDD